MKRIVQSRTGEDGTCFRACVASIVGVPEKRIPDFGEGGNDECWWTDVQSWLGWAGLEYVRTPIDGAKPVGYSTIEGVSPRGGMHACVALDGELIWDPHPIEDGTGQGLVEPRYYGVFKPIRTSGGDWTAYDKRPLGRGEDRADMAALRRNTEKQGGPFLMQVTGKNGRTRAVPTKQLIKEN